VFPATWPYPGSSTIIFVARWSESCRNALEAAKSGCKFFQAALFPTWPDFSDVGVYLVIEVQDHEEHLKCYVLLSQVSFGTARAFSALEDFHEPQTIWERKGMVSEGRLSLLPD